MGISFWQIGVVLVLVLLLFGRGRISHMMGDLAKGIKSFKRGMKDEEIEDKEVNNLEKKSDKEK